MIKNIAENGLIFTTDGTTFKPFDLLLDGKADTFGNAVELESFGTDSGGLSIQDATTLEIINIELGSMPAYMWRKWSHIAGLKYIKINGLYYQLKEWETPARETIRTTGIAGRYPFS